MKEYQVSFGKYVSKAELPALLKQLGYQGGAGGEGIILESVTTWYLKTGLSSDVTRETDPTGWKDYFTPPDPSSSGRYVWRYMDYWYTTNHHTPDFHVYTDCELVTMYSSGGGMGVEFAYALFDKIVSEVTVLNEGEGNIPDTDPSAAWTKDLDTLIYNASQYLWMSQRIMDGETVGPWQKPIRISGKDGVGADGLDTEFIYKQMGRKPNSNEPAPVTENPLVNRNKDDYYPESDGWNDCPQGVEDDGLHNFEWMSYRTLLTENDPDYGTYKWSEFSTPIIWSAYGEKGMDGDGIEYVYKHVLDITNFEVPASPKFYTTEGDTVTWYGGVVLNNPGNPNNSNDWLPKDYNSSSGAFEYWIGGKYGPQGEWIPKIDPDGGNEDSNFWSDDPEGVGYFIRYQQNGQPVLDEDNNPVQDLYKYEYVTSRKRVNGEWGEFSEPKIWSTFSKEHTVEIIDGEWWIDGVNQHIKAEGENGTGIDLKGKVDYYDANHRDQLISEGYEEDPNHVYTFLSDVEDTYNPKVGDCWVVTLNGHIYLYVGGEDDTPWEDHWVDFGEFQGEGAYVHIAWALSISYENGEIISSGFELDQNINGSTIDYPWMGICTNNNRRDPEEASAYKWNYVQGRDGDNIERVFIRTAVEVAPQLEYTVGVGGIIEYPPYTINNKSYTYQSSEYLPFLTNPIDVGEEPNITPGCYPDSNTYVQSLGKYQFTDDPLGGVTVDLPYLWMVERKKRDGEWKPFGTPSLHATYSHNGQSIVRSTIFRRWNSLTQRPPKPSPSLGSFYYPAGDPEDTNWKDGIPSGTGAIWKSERIFTSDEQPPQWDEWSTPTLVRDDDNYDVELSNQPRNVTPIPPIDYNETGGNRHDPSGTDPSGYDHSNETPPGKKQLWFDPVDDATYITNNASSFNWMATRTKFVNSNDLPEWRPWTIVLIKGEDGATGPEGAGFQHAYIVIDGDATPNIVPNPEDNPAITIDDFVTNANGTSGYWTLNTTSGLSVGPNQYLWMSERSVSVSGYGPWGDPIKLSGNGTPGEDAEDIEFIYKRADHLPDNSSSSEDRPSEENGKDGKTYDQDDFVPVGWEDNPQGVGYFIEKDENDQNVEVFYKYEWMCQRIKPRTGDIVDPSDPWGHWSRIFVWSAYGDTGMDGDGIEYVYTRNSTAAGSAPASPKAIGTSGNITWKWGVEYKNGSWEPKDWEAHASNIGDFDHWDSSVGEYNPQGEWIPGGSYDNQGRFVEGNWTDEPQGVGEAYQDPNPYYDNTQPASESNPQYITKYRNLFEWVSQRKCVNGEWGNFSTPTLWSSYSVSPDLKIIDGVWYLNGEPIGQAEGPSGKGVALKGSVDVIYHVDADPAEGKLALQDVYPHVDPNTEEEYYLDLAPGDCYVVRQNGHLYLCLHDITNWNPDRQTDYTGTGKSWEPVHSSTNSDPNWEDIGEFQGQGSYMHIAWAASNDDVYGTENITFGQDGKISMIKHYLIDYALKDPDIDYDWMGVLTNNDEDDLPDNYDNPSLGWNNGNSSTWNWKKYKWNHVRGRDGDNYERVYLRTTSADRPSIGNKHIDPITQEVTITFDPYYDEEFPNTGPGRTFQDQEYLPAIVDYDPNVNSTTGGGRCTDDPVGVTNVFRYEWMAERRKKLNTSTHNVEWFGFSLPALWARYSTDGNHGKSTQIKYYSFLKTVTPELDEGKESDPTPTSGNGTQVWQDNTAGLTISSQYFLWMIQRVTVDPEHDTTTEWCDPIRLSGEDGDPGADGLDIEFVYQRNNSKPKPVNKPSQPTARKKADHNTTKVWKGDVKDVSSNSTPIWEPVDWDSSGSTGEWSLWEWDPTAGKYNSQGDWIPIITVGSGNVESTYWTDSPKGVGEDSNGDFYKYEWMTQRTKNVTTGKWNDWINPVVWSAYGDKGMDGDGVEYVFYRGSSAPNTPIGPRAIQGATTLPWYGGVKYGGKDENENDIWLPVDWDSTTYGDWDDWGWDTNYAGYYGPQGEWLPLVTGTGENNKYWTDDPTGVINQDGKRQEWVSSRKRTNGVWDAFSSPRLWASYGTFVEIKNGVWWIDGVETQWKAEGEDGKGVALKGAVDVLEDSDKNGDETLLSLQDLQPNSNKTGVPASVEIGDCFVVRANRYLYTSKKRYGQTSGTNDWDTGEGQSDGHWWLDNEGDPGPGQENWAEVGEFQGADGESRFMHIAWAPARYNGEVNVVLNSSGNVTQIKYFEVQWENLSPDINYEWMGIGTDDIEDDPVNNYNNSSLGWNSSDDTTWNWKKYKWNHVKGRDGSDYEKVYIRTTQETTKPILTVNNDGTYSTYTDSAGPHSYQGVDYLPAINNQAACGAEFGRCTDDPKGVDAAYPFEWVFERRKSLNDVTQVMEWKSFTGPALWATYSFDGFSAQLTKNGDSIAIDAAGNIEGGIGNINDPSSTSFSPRLYTEVKIWDPNYNNGVGGYLSYQSTGNTPNSNCYILNITKDPDDNTNFVYGITTSGLIYISKLGNTNNWRKTRNECKLNIEVTAYGGRKFNFVYTITLTHNENTYFTYSLSNDFDSITYRTKTQKYDGLPVDTKIDAQINGKTIGKTSEIPLTQGFMKSVTVESDLLDYATTAEDVDISDSTVTVTTTVTGTGAWSSYGTNNGIKIKTSSGDDTGLRLDISSNGSITLKSAGLTTDTDLPDARHYMNISCELVYMGVNYQSVVKTFTLLEANDLTMYDLSLSSVSVIEKLGTYTPNAITAKAMVSDENGVTTYTPNASTGKIGSGSIYVKFFKGKASSLTASTSTTSFFYPCSNVASNVVLSNGTKTDTLTAVIVDMANTSSLVYHDFQEINVSHEVPESYIDLTPTQFVVECDSNGNIASNRTLNYSAWLKWGGHTCTSSEIVRADCSISATMSGFSTGTTGTPTAEMISSSGELSGSFGFTTGSAFTPGEINFTMKGSINGNTTIAHGTIIVTSQEPGGPGPRGDFKSTAFIRTNDSIGSWTPTGGAYTGTTTYPNGPIPTGFSDNHAVTDGGTWEDGIPSGDKRLWSSSCTFYGAQYPLGHSTWSNPVPVKDTETYDVEFALMQSNDGTPPDPIDIGQTNANRHDPNHPSSASGPGYTGQIWFDPELDKAYVQANYKNFYWKAERETKNEIPGPWVVTRIKGESEPWVKVDKTNVTIVTGPTGNLSTAQEFTIKSWLWAGNTKQTPIRSSCSLPNPNTSIIYNINKSTVGSDGSITWTITTKTGTMTNVDLQITMANATYSATKTIPVIFDNKNQSQVKSFIFKRFASQSAANSDTLITSITDGVSPTGSFTYPGPGGEGNPYSWNNWSDGLPSSGTNPIYMTSRLFTSDGQPPQQNTWSTPVMMSDTEAFNVEFSPRTSKPVAPSSSNSHNNNNQYGYTNQIWFDPVLDKYSAAGVERDFSSMIWMATSTTKDSSGNWINWAIVKIKGETGESQHIDSTDAYYKIFDTLNVQMPADDDENDLATWTTTQIKPTKELPYLWRFFRTEYSNPSRAENYGLELVQVWSENMINPNLLNDTDFEPEDIRDNGAVSGSNLGGASSDAGGTMGAWRTWNVSNLRTYATWGKNNGLSNDLPPLGGSYYGGIATKGDTTKTGYIIVLKQNIYDSSLGLYKVNPGNWYTLSFWIHGSSAYPDATFYLQILSRNSLGAGVDGMEIVDTDAGVTVNDHVINGRTADFSYVATDNSSVSINYNQYTNNWRKFVITFKIKDTIPDNLVTALLEWKLSVAENIAKGAGVYINKPKLEIGKVATDYISSSAIRDPYPRTSAWKGGQQYYQGQYGEPYLDVVSYGGNWFRCRSTHISKDTVYNSEGIATSMGNEPIIGQTTLYWEPAENLSFIATDLVLAKTAFIENLVASGIRTGEIGTPHVEMTGSKVAFYGIHEYPSIVLDIDTVNPDDKYYGCGILKFFDKNGNFLYDLGPREIHKVSTSEVSSTYSPYYYKSLSESNKINAIMTISYSAVNGGYSAGPLTETSSGVTKYYRFTEGTHVTVNQSYYNVSNGASPSSWNNCIFKTNSYTDSDLQSTAFPGSNILIPNGWYATIYMIGYSDQPMSIDGTEPEFQHTFIYNFYNGKIVKSTRVYYKVSEIQQNGSYASLYDGNGHPHSNLRSFMNNGAVSPIID